MSLVHLPANLEEGVESYVVALQISHDEALIKIIETGIGAINTPPDFTKEVEESRISGPEDLPL